MKGPMLGMPSKSEEDSGGGSDTDDVGQDMLDAIKAGDAKALGLAVKRCCTMCMSEEGDDIEV